MCGSQNTVAEETQRVSSDTTGRTVRRAGYMLPYIGHSRFDGAPLGFGSNRFHLFRGARCSRFDNETSCRRKCKPEPETSTRRSASLRGSVTTCRRAGTAVRIAKLFADMLAPVAAKAVSVRRKNGAALSSFNLGTAYYCFGWNGGFNVISPRCSFDANRSALHREDGLKITIHAAAKQFPCPAAV